ncbi:hypothetical protein Q6348_07195 [Isoptericola sp. b441]|uniref:Uncharacterized protein n=1 Tax=Actinotalea lenta TaxID=3064654 RepID=A0ABT9D7Z0_9CELL|nr:MULTISPECIES: hypothetical protein [unclassified Isoptericola]MDO8106982.1 hypothetical protein [Isoptericola sp. b441]MDO8121308.1 hypothetical protein [Isoptericola sp. b490]
MSRARPADLPRPRAVDPDASAPRRGVSVVLELPEASPRELLEVADTLHSLALDLVPGASARTEVRLTD